MPGAASLTMTTLLPNRRVWSEGLIYEGGAGDPSASPSVAESVARGLAARLDVSVEDQGNDAENFPRRPPLARGARGPFLLARLPLQKTLRKLVTPLIPTEAWHAPEGLLDTL